MMDSIQFGDTKIPFSVRRSTKRRDLAITVDGNVVVVTASAKVDDVEVRRRVRQKAAWILQKLDENRLVEKVYPRKLVSGESFHYLGRQYSLRVLRGGEKGVKLWRGEMVLTQGGSLLTESERGKLLRAWYRSHLLAKLVPILERFASQLDLQTPVVQVRELGGRWGSCGKNGVLYFHWKLARLPLSKVEFVCAHEMVHLLEPCHSKEFSILLAKILPEYEGWSRKLSL